MEDLLTRQKADVSTPKNYNVVLLNDDYTTIDFVIFALVQIFRKSREEAFSLAESIHNSGRGVAGTYTREIAETKAMTCEQLARKEGFPLKTEIQTA